MTNQYKYGRDNEKKVAQSLIGKGAKVQLSPGSKGASDLTARFPTGTKWTVQVKSTRGSKPNEPSTRDLGRLKQSSTKIAATPVVANVTPKGIKYRSARSGRTLKPPTRRK